MKFLDGSFGTYYADKIGDRGRGELANISNKNAVLSIHKEYIESGADIILTNTFRANPGIFEDGELLEKIITEGLRIAEEAVCGTSASVFADIGGISDDDAPEQYMRVAELFINAGAKNFIFETLPSFDGIAAAADKIKSDAEDSVIIASFAVSREGYSENGSYFKTMLEQAVSCPAIDIVGLNCVCGPAHMLKLAKQLNGIKKPLLIMPNSGYASYICGRVVFQDNADYFAEKMNEISKLGVEMLGGCCGTTPEHIKKMIELVKTGVKQRKEGAKTYKSRQSFERLKMKPIMVELDPPVDADSSFVTKAAEKLVELGVDTITLSDSPLSKPRADSVITAAKLKTVAQMDVMPHITCRDKNSIALRGSFLGAHFFGINKALIVTGDPVIDDGSKKSASVFNFNSTQLISYINKMNNEVFKGHGFSIGAALNVNAARFDLELERAHKKIAKGASFLLTQPIFTETAVENFKMARRTLDCKLYAGILPVAGYRNAIFLSNEVAGVKIPEGVIESMKDKAEDEVYNISLNYCAGIIGSVYNEADGFYIMTPLRKIDLVCQLISRCFYV